MAHRQPGRVITAAVLAAALTAGLAGCVSQTPDDERGQDQEHTTVAQPSPAVLKPSAPHRYPSAFHLSPAHGRGHLAPGSAPRALPGDVLIADKANNRLLLVDPYGRIRWRFPRPGALPRGQAFGPPDDAFVSPNGRAIIATQEDDDTVSVIDIARGRVTRRYGHPDVQGSAPGFFSHPDDAMLLPGGELLVSDIMNCRILLLSPGKWHVVRIRRHMVLRAQPTR